MCGLAAVRRPGDTIIGRCVKLIAVSTIQVADQTFIAAPAGRISTALGKQSRWRRWWPDLDLTVREDRAEKGIRWTVGGALTGTMEVWLEPVLDGVILHYFLHAEPSASASGRVAEGNRDVAVSIRRRRVAGKVMSFELKKELERGRAVGEPPS